VAASTKATRDANVAPACWTCSFVNNMPDTAFDQTERQFLDLLDAGSVAEVIEVRRHAMSGVPRGEQVAAKIAEEYSPVDLIRLDPPDVLIVTGSNPIEERIEDEPYWAEMVELLSWAKENVRSMMLSCLSAHAALAIFDGAERKSLDVKRTGVFAQYVDQTHPLTLGIEQEILLPHSRKNMVPSDVLEDAGYRVLVQSDDVGWSVATKDVGMASVVLVQGHPEYEPSSLLREYRRDVGRYLRRERDDLPVLPLHCVASEDWELLESMHRMIIGGRRDPAIFEEYPFDEIGDRAPWPWRSMAKQLYANWLVGIGSTND
jgi:homoserine O-succinyltransferase